MKETCDPVQVLGVPGRSDETRGCAERGGEEDALSEGHQEGDCKSHKCDGRQPVVVTGEAHFRLQVGLVQILGLPLAV